MLENIQYQFNSLLDAIYLSQTLHTTSCPGKLVYVVRLADMKHTLFCHVMSRAC